MNNRTMKNNGLLAVALLAFALAACSGNRTQAQAKTSNATATDMGIVAKPQASYSLGRGSVEVVDSQSLRLRNAVKWDPPMPKCHDNEVVGITIGYTTADGKHYGETHALDIGMGLTLDIFHGLQEIPEWDINFDGIPDVLFDLGTGVDGDKLYIAYVWDRDHFEDVYGFMGIPNPEVDVKGRCIISKYLNEEGSITFNKWEWKDGMLVVTKEWKETLQ